MFFNCGDPGLRPIGSSHLALREQLIPAASPNTGMLRYISLEEISRRDSGRSISVDDLGKADELDLLFHIFNLCLI